MLPCNKSTIIIDLFYAEHQSKKLSELNKSHNSNWLNNIHLSSETFDLLQIENKLNRRINSLFGAFLIVLFKKKKRVLDFLFYCKFKGCFACSAGLVVN